MLRTIRRVMLIIISSGVVLLLVALAVLHLGADTRLVNSLVRTLIPGATTSVADVAGNYFSGWIPRCSNRRENNTVIGCDTIRATYRIKELLSDSIRIRRVELSGPVVNLRQSSGWIVEPLSPRKAERAVGAEVVRPQDRHREVHHNARPGGTLRPNTRRSR